MERTLENVQNPLATLDNFNQLASETQHSIFSGLRGNDLKNCRMVCMGWNERVSTESLLHSAVILVYNEDYRHNPKTLWKNVLRGFHLYRRKLIFTIPAFRFYNRVGLSIFLWFTKDNMKNLTSIEFRDCSLYIQQLLLLFRKMPNINSLTLSGPSSMINSEQNLNPNDRDFMKKYYMDESMKNFQKLKKCDIELYQQKQCVVFLELLMLKCDQIEDLSLKIPDNYGWHHTDVFKRLSDYLKTLSRTLRVLHVQFKSEGGFQPHLAVAGIQPPNIQGGLGSLDTFLEKVHLEQWRSFPLTHLQDLSLDFQLTKSDLPRIETSLVPFLLSLESLKKLNLKQLSVVSGDEEGVFNIVPPSCRLAKIESIQLAVPVDPTALVAPVVLVDPAAPLAGADLLNPAAPELDFLDRSTIEIVIRNVSWKMSMVDWNARFTRTMVEDRIEGLTKLNVYQFQVPQPYQLQVTDEFLQRVIERATNLVELSLEHCALENLSDYGITGISAEAGLRMRTSGNYEIQPGDQTGAPLSCLTKLQILRLNPGLTNSVTDITARLAFLGTRKLRVLSLAKPEISENGLTALRDIFAANQVVQICVNIGLVAEED